MLKGKFEVHKGGALGKEAQKENITAISNSFWEISEENPQVTNVSSTDDRIMSAQRRDGNRKAEGCFGGAWLGFNIKFC